MPSLETSHWPEPLRGRAEVAGVYVGGCVDGGRRFRRKAHAHTEGQHQGWICYLGSSRLDDVRLARHELAHIISGHGHDDKWRSAIEALWGGSANVPKSERAYRKVPRAAGAWCKTGFHGMCKGRDEGSGDTVWYREGQVDRITKGRVPGRCKCACHQ